MERERFLRKLKKTNEELESFAYVASHDLKAPLRGIDNLVSWIVEDPDSRLSEESQRNAGRLRTRVVRLEALLDGLLEYSRIGKRRSKKWGRWTPGSCASKSQNTWPRPMVSRFPPRRIYRSSTRSSRRWRPCCATSSAMPSSHHDRDDGRIEVSAVDQGEAYRFIVRDDGPGIDPAHHDRVFEIFQTLAPRSRLDTSGIGLSIVTRLVASAGGSIHIESDAGERGTAFHFTWKKTWPTDGD